MIAFFIVHDTPIKQFHHVRPICICTQHSHVYKIFLLSDRNIVIFCKYFRPNLLNILILTSPVAKSYKTEACHATVT